MPRELPSAVLLPARLLPALCIVAAVVAVYACAHQPAPAAAPPVDQVRALEQRYARDSTNTDLRIRLAAAYRGSDRLADARRLLEPVVRREPLAAYHLALVSEDQQRWAAARALYQDFLQRTSNAALQQTVRTRLALVQRQELEEAVRGALARERQLADSVPPARTVGVFPFFTVTADTTLRPLGTALAELLSTDLAQTERVRVVERVQLKVLLDEMALGATERVDPRTAARSGRILGASNIVQGRVDGGQAQLTMQTAVVRVPAPTGAPPAPIRATGSLARIFELEKNLALSIYERLGVQLTTAERQRVTRQHTSNVQALLAFGYGLEAQDAGRYADAYAQYQRAVQLDPNFARAREKMDESSRLGQAAALSVDALAALAATPEPTPPAPGGRPAAAAPALSASALRFQRLLQFSTIEQLITSPLIRNPAVEAAGTEGAVRSGQAELIIRRPGGGQ